MQRLIFLVLLSVTLPYSSGFVIPTTPTTITTTTHGRTITTTQLSAAAAATIQFIRGLDEGVVPDVKLTRARDGSSGVATFLFKSPQCFDASTAMQGDVTGMFLLDEEGELKTTEVNAKFANGKPQTIEATYVMKSSDEWDRFMRFMERYAEANELGFTKA